MTCIWIIVTISTLGNGHPKNRGWEQRAALLFAFVFQNCIWCLLDPFPPVGLVPSWQFLACAGKISPVLTSKLPRYGFRVSVPASPQHPVLASIVANPRLGSHMRTPCSGLRGAACLRELGLCERGGAFPPESVPCVIPLSLLFSPEWNHTSGNSQALGLHFCHRRAQGCHG